MTETDLHGHLEDIRQPWVSGGRGSERLLEAPPHLSPAVVLRKDVTLDDACHEMILQKDLRLGYPYLHCFPRGL